MTQNENMPPRRVTASVEGKLGWLRIDNPGRLNAMSLSMWTDLAQGLDMLAADEAVRAIVVTGGGDKAFCAGGDISEFATVRAGADAMKSYDAAAKAALSRLCDVAKPTLALIHGYCLGAGMGLALQCDLRVASGDARLGIPAAKRGLSYDFGGIKQLVNLVGPSQAKHILYSARQYSAEEARAMGLVNEVKPHEEVEDHVRALATEIANNAPLSVRATKLIVGMVVADPDQRDLAACIAAEAACLDSEDYAEATRAFTEKRSVVFQGR